MALLETKNLVKRFGGLAAVNDVTMSVNEGEIRGVIGPNGAGKTTLFNLVSGAMPVTSGTITFNGEQVSGKRPSQIASAGLVRTFQRNAMFPTYSVVDNIMLSRHTQVKGNLFRTVFAPHQEDEHRERAGEIMRFLELEDHADDLATNLPHGYQRILGIANALAAEPKLIMLDEPMAGLNPTETKMVAEHISRLRDEWDMTVVLVEHDMRTVMETSDNITVINFGEMLMEGTPDEVASDPRVIEAYLGSDDYDL